MIMPISKTQNRIPDGWSAIRIGAILSERNEKVPTAPGDHILTSSRKGLFLQSDYFKRVVSLENIVGYKRMLRGDFTFRSMSDDGLFVFNRLKEFDHGFISPAYFVFYCSDADPDFIEYLINSDKLQAQIYKSAQGSTRTALKFSKLKDFSLIIPDSKYEQQKIAGMLSIIDEAIEKTDQLIEKYKRVKEGLMQDLFCFGIDEHGQIRSESPHHFKDSPLGRIPEEWEVNFLSRWADIFGGYAFRSSDYKENGVQLIKIGNLYNNQLCLDREPTFLPWSYIESYNNYILRDTDIIMSMTGTYGKRDYGFAVEIKGKDVYLLNQRVCKFVLKNGLSKKFLLYLLQSNNYLKNIYQAEGTKQANLNSGSILDIPVAIPSFAEQSRISIILTNVDEIIEKEECYKIKLMSLKQGLLEDLLSGAVRVNHLIKE